MADPIAARFTRESADHVMKVLHDDGLYRHVRFSARPKPPALPHSMYWFELITTPGQLVFSGDGDSFVFRREQDMFGFFLGSAWRGRPNYGYWAEKLVDRREHVMVYDRELLEAAVRETVAEAVAESPELSGLPEAVERDVIDEFIGDESLDRHQVEAFKFYLDENKRYDWTAEPDFTFGEIWEWNCRSYDWWFRWACHAIVWGVAQYRAGYTGGPREDRPAVAEPVPAAGARTVTTLETTGGVL